MCVWRGDKPSEVSPWAALLPQLCSVLASFISLFWFQCLSITASVHSHCYYQTLFPAAEHFSVKDLKVINLHLAAHEPADQTITKLERNETLDMR